MKVKIVDKKAKIDNKSVIIHLITKENNPLKLDKKEFKNEYGETFLFYDEKSKNMSVAIGLGEEKHLDVAKLEHVGNIILKYVEKNKFKNITLVYDGKNDLDTKMFNVLVGLELSNYSFNKYFLPEKQEEKSIKLESVTVVADNVKNMEKNYKDFLVIKENVFFCRNLVNEPANVINPDTYSEICEQLVDYGLDVEILGEDEMADLGMNSLLAVGQGSVYESKLVVLKWQGLKKFENPVAFVGKGITFDSGGLSLKPDQSMYDMKSDMAGSAVVVATMKLLAQRKAKVNAVGVIGLVENMPSGSAVKPGDVVESMSKQTVEILCTDAEGRLILADELYYAVTNFNPTVVIDLATLTGACCVALGSVNAGVFTNNDKLAEEISKSSKEVNENTWRLPLGELGSAYDKMMNSSVADVKNISGVRLAGAITAAQFLQRFINKHKKWAHIDIAGTVFLTSAESYGAKGIYTVNDGATGYGVRLLNNLICKYYEK